MNGIKTESALLLKLALPILLAQLALTGLGVVDTLMSGQVGTNDLAAIGLGSSIMLPVFMFSTGILLAITPLVAKADGQSKPQRITSYLTQGVWLSLPLGVLSLVVLMNLEWVLDLLSLNDVVYQLTRDYLFYIAFGMPAIALYQVLRFFWEGLGTTLPTMWISFFALLINIPLNAVFIYGFGFIDPMGAAGCGVASSIVMWIMLLLGILYVIKSKLTQPFLDFKSHVFSINWTSGLKPILALGVPTTFALLFEVSLFSMIALFVAPLGAVVIAGHQIAINFTSLAFMIPLSFAMALTVRVGVGYGEHNQAQLRLSLITGFLFALVLGALLAVISYFLRIEIVSLYSKEADVLYLAASLLVFAAIYQVFDAIQVTAAGALRGFHDSQITMLVTFVSYWGIGLGLGYVFAFTDWIFSPMGVLGFWLGIVLGLLLASILLPLRLKRVYRLAFIK
ncbi:Multidrug efflux transporter MdtK/NorM (MATE family) [hydrothermal vent metagenome]|uniref:Multidrug-efflux transporter n=1 Tax=hydrothermal vent metagenome TaxID=652676 RepID=A0A3B0VXL5_9ZZZZ